MTKADVDLAYNNYVAKQNEYNESVNLYNGFKTLPTAGKYKSRMDAAKIAMDDAFRTYNLAKTAYESQAAIDFAAANPNAAVEIAIGQAQAVADAGANEIKAKGEALAIEEKAKTNKTITILVVVVVVVSLAGFVYFKFIKKK